MIKTIPGGLISRRGIAVQMKEGAVIVSCGDIQHSIDSNSDQWWNLFVQNQDNIDNFFESVALHKAVPSTVRAGNLLFPSQKNQGWLREVDLRTLQHNSISSAIQQHQSFDYEGKVLICPQDHGIRAVELCGDPGAHYGPWQIMSVCDDAHWRLIGGAEDFDSVVAQANEMGRNGKPEPLPSPRDDGSIVLELPKGLTGVINQQAFYGSDGRTLNFNMTLLDHNLEPLVTLALGDRLDTAILVRDDEGFRRGLLKEKCPDFDASADNSAYRKPYDQEPERHNDSLAKESSFPNDIPF